VETLGAWELVAGLTLAWPKLVVPEEVWVADDVEVDVEVVAGDAAVAAWLERARPIPPAKASAEPSTSPRRARAARRRAILIGTAAMVVWDHHGVRDR
jgi:hypothetical protein